MEPGFENAASYRPLKPLKPMECLQRRSGIGGELGAFPCPMLMAVGSCCSHRPASTLITSMNVSFNRLANHAEGVQYATKSLADIERGFRVLRVGDRNRPGVPPLAGSYSRPCSHLLYGADPGSGDARTAARPICAACRQSGRCPCWAGSSTTVSRPTKPHPFQESPPTVRSELAF